MSKLRIIALVCLAVSSSTVAFTSDAKPCCCKPIVIPCAANKYRLGISALYLRPNFGGNGLGYSSFSNYGTDFFNNSVEVNGASNNLHNITPNRAWGFQLEGAYLFTPSNDLDINWYHLDENTGGHFPTGTLFAGSASALYAGRFNIQPRWDSVTAELGQVFCLNQMNEFHLHAGLDYSRVQTTFTNYPQLTPTGSPIFTTNDQITYTGLGPTIGGDYTYYSGFGLGLYIKAAGSLLVGSARQAVTGYSDLGGFNLYSTGNYNQSNSNVVIPKLEANLGLKYDYNVGCGVVSFDAGYMFVSYLGALVSQVGAGVVSSSISTSSSTNFNLNGPHIGVTWTGNI